MKRNELAALLHKSPVIAAVRTPEAAVRAAASRSPVAFLLGGRVEEPKAVVMPGRDWQHVLLPIAKVGKTARHYPRKAGTPGKAPLGASVRDCVPSC